MKMNYIGLGIVLLILMASFSMAYSGFNRYYYTDNYAPSTYFPSPGYVNAYNNSYAYTGYGYPSIGYAYGYNYYPSIVYNTSYYKEAPVVVYSTPAYTPYYYNAPVYNYGYGYGGYGSGMTFYSGSNGWGISISRGATCGYYGYC